MTSARGASCGSSALHSPRCLGKSREFRRVTFERSLVWSDRFPKSPEPTAIGNSLRMAPPRIGIIANTQKPEASEVLARLEAAFSRLQVPCILEAETAALRGGQRGLAVDDLICPGRSHRLAGGRWHHPAPGETTRAEGQSRSPPSTSAPRFPQRMGAADQLDEIAAHLASRQYRISYRSVIRVRAFVLNRLMDERHALDEVAPLQPRSR